METKWMTIKQEDLEPTSRDRLLKLLQVGGDLLRREELVAFPTETVYGLGANALSEAACQKIYEAKGRPSDNPLIVHVTSVKQAREIVKEWPAEAKVCARHFWPGPLTLVLPKKDRIPSIVSGGLATVAVRMPAHPVALTLIDAAGVPLAAPSANISGKPSPTEGKHVWEDLRGKIPLLIDAGKCSVGLESTVLDLAEGRPTILRPGGITREQLEAVLGSVDLDFSLQDEAEAAVLPKAPGMKYRHYAPRGEVHILQGDLPKKQMQIEDDLRQSPIGVKTALLCMEETAKALPSAIISRLDLVFIFGSANQPGEAASKLFEGLRLCDEKGINRIFVEEMPVEGIGLAYMNRLQKAAGNKSKA